MEKLIVKVLFTTFSTTWVSCTISGLNYMDPINFKPLKSLPSDDPCRPLFWYPRNIPEYCYYRSSNDTETKPPPIPLPIPVPLPGQPFPFPMPMPPMYPQYPMPSPYPMPPPYPMPSPYPMPPPPMPIPMFPTMPLPYGIPIEPTYPMLPVAGIPGMPFPNPFQPYRPRGQAGLVPGLPGMVTQDGGINILPFSDVYADVLEKHKQRILRKKLQKVLNDYEGYPKNRRHSRNR